MLPSGIAIQLLPCPFLALTMSDVIAQWFKQPIMRCPLIAGEDLLDSQACIFHVLYNFGNRVFPNVRDVIGHVQVVREILAVSLDDVSPVLQSLDIRLTGNVWCRENQSPARCDQRGNSGNRSPRR